MLPSGKSYEEVRKASRWQIPARYNIGLDVCDRWADGSGRLALIHQRHDGGVDHYSFDALKRLSTQLANVLAAYGVRRVDRVGILLPQTPETAFRPYRNLQARRRRGVSRQPRGGGGYQRHRSTILSKNIALCRMDVAHAAIGGQVEVGKIDGH